MKKMEKIWNKLAGLSLSIKLLVLSSLLMVINSRLAESRSQLYHNLNTTPLWSWLKQVWKEDLLVGIAMAVLLAFLGLLALNTFACTFTRLSELVQGRRKNRNAAAGVIRWAPTVMHSLFFLALAGHMATFSFGAWQIHKLQQGESLHYSSAHPPISVVSFSRVVRDVPGPLDGSVVEHRAEVDINGSRSTISELNPARLPNGDWLLLLPPQLRNQKGRIPVDTPVDCSLEERHVEPIPFSPEQPIRFKQVSDPGVPFLFTGLVLIFLLIIIHYAVLWSIQGRSNSSGRLST